jgi:hypothetical protein
MRTRAGSLLGGRALNGHLFMGDSWTAITTWADSWSTANPSILTRKIALGGWTIANLQTQVGLAVSYAPRSISILIGLNDIVSLSSTAWIASLQWLVASLRAGIPGVKILVSTVPASVSQAGTNTARNIVNPILRAAVGSWIDAIIPFGDYITDTDPGDGIASTTLYNNAQNPGHPTPVLDNIMLQIFSAVINPFYAGSNATTPSQFTFPDQPGATASQTYTALTNAPITGMALGNVALAVNSGSGTFQSNRSVASDTSSKPIINGDWPAATVTASATVSPPTAVDETVTIGTTADTFTATTGPVASDDFNRANGAPGNTPVGNLPWTTTALAGGYAAVNPGIQDVDFTIDVTISASGTGTPVIFLGATKTGVQTTMAAFTEYYIIDLTAGLCRVHTTGGALVTLFAFAGLARGATYTCRVVSKVSTRTITLYVNGTAVTLTSGSNTYANDPNWIPDGTWLGVYEPNINALNMIDNLSIIAAT